MSIISDRFLNQEGRYGLLFSSARNLFKKLFSGLVLSPDTISFDKSRLDLGKTAWDWLRGMRCCYLFVRGSERYISPILRSIVLIS